MHEQPKKLPGVVSPARMRPRHERGGGRAQTQHSQGRGRGARVHRAREEDRQDHDIDCSSVEWESTDLQAAVKISEWKKKGIVNFDGLDFKTNLKAALILPDGNENSPAYLVFRNYEKILKWNRSLRFGISVCTLAGKINI